MTTFVKTTTTQQLPRNNNHATITTTRNNENNDHDIVDNNNYEIITTTRNNKNKNHHNNNSLQSRRWRGEVGGRLALCPEVRVSRRLTSSGQAVGGVARLRRAVSVQTHCRCTGCTRRTVGRRVKQWTRNPLLSISSRRRRQGFSDGRVRRRLVPFRRCRRLRRRSTRTFKTIGVFFFVLHLSDFRQSFRSARV